VRWIGPGVSPGAATAWSALACSKRRK
jgi:hypothetical protein